MNKILKTALFSTILATTVLSCSKKSIVIDHTPDITFQAMEAEFKMNQPFSEWAKGEILKKYGSTKAFHEFVIAQRIIIAKHQKVRTDPFWVDVTFTNPFTGIQTVVKSPSDEFLLNTAAMSGLDLPTCDMAGASPGCVGQVLNGSISQDDQSFLDDDQLAAGFALLCVALPQTDVEILTNQEENLY